MEQWSLVWFGLLFWGSIFGAALLYLFEASNFVALVGYALGLTFGLLSKSKGWSWIS
jgi:hypothetical protein